MRPKTDVEFAVPFRNTEGQDILRRLPRHPPILRRPIEMRSERLGDHLNRYRALAEPAKAA
jgi:hypothetical protein